MTARNEQTRQALVVSERLNVREEKSTGVWGCSGGILSRATRTAESDQGVRNNEEDEIRAEEPRKKGEVGCRVSGEKRETHVTVRKEKGESS